MSEENPYASPPIIAPIDLEADDRQLGLDDHELKKAERIIKEATDVWVVILFCIPCCAFGALVTPVYLFRLRQWNYLAQKHPVLLVSNAPRGSLQAKFKAARWKLVTGLVACIAIFASLFLVFLSI